MVTLPPHVLKTRGVPITLVDGREVVVVYTFSSLMRLEEDFGSVAGALGELKKGESGAAFGSIARILAAGLEHESGENGARLDDVNVLRSLLDSTELGSYSDSLGQAFEKAFPSAPEDADAVDPTKTTPSSPGTGGTTPEPSLSVGQSLSSG